MGKVQHVSDVPRRRRWNRMHPETVRLIRAAETTRSGWVATTYETIAEAVARYAALKRAGLEVQRRGSTLYVRKGDTT